jgi:hypothetical protein
VPQFAPVKSFIFRRRRWFLAVGGLLLAYAAIGFLLFPWVLHHQLERRLSAALHREVSIERVRANPFMLSVTVDGLLVKDRDGAPLLSWERLYVKARLVPLVLREADLSALQLIRLHARINLAKDGNLNISDLMSSPDSESPPAPAPLEEKHPLVFGVDHLALVEAQLDFSDFSHRHPFHSTVGPFTIRLDDFRTRADAKNPYAFTGTTEAGETFAWSGSVHVDPIRSNGTLSLDGIRLPKYTPYYEQSVGFDLLDGTARVQSSYQLEWGADKRILRASDGTLALRKLVLRLRGAAEPFLEVPEFDVQGVQVDLLEQVAAVELVSLRGASVHVGRGADGQIDLTRLFQGADAAPPAAAKHPAKPAKPFRWTVHKVELKDEKVAFEDQLPERPVKLVLAPINVTVGNLSSDRAAMSTVALGIGWNGKGQLDVDGGFSLWKPSAELTIQAHTLDLPSIDGYFPLYAGLGARLSDGKLTVNGRFHADLATEPPALGFEGDVTVDSLILVDSQRGQELIRWKALQILGIRFAMAPQSVSIRSVRWLEPRVRVQLEADGSSNVRRILRTGAPSPDNAPKAAPTAKPAAAGPAPPPISVATFQLVRGSCSFIDRSVQPPALFALSDLEVRIRGLSNDLSARAQVDIDSTFSGGPLKMSGILSPRFKNDATDLKITSKDIDLTPFGPYFGKYVGFALEKGKLDLDLTYKVAQRHVDAQNLVRVDQLTLGEETHSPDATKLPVKLGLAILQDRDGLIELDVPVDGNVDDPDFRLGKVIWRAVGNIFAKLVTAPFAALGALFGGSNERLDLVDFTVGTAELDSRSQKTVQNLAKALYSRPGLKLEIQGTVDPTADGAVLRKQALRARAKEDKWKGHKGSASSPDSVQLLEDEYVKWVEAEYKRTLSTKADPAKPPSVTEMEERLLAATTLGPEALPALARQRAEVAQQRLLQSARVEAARLFIVDGGERASKEQGAHVYFTLK